MNRIHPFQGYASLEREIPRKGGMADPLSRKGIIRLCTVQSKGFFTSPLTPAERGLR